MSDQSISVVMATYNGARYIREAIDSIRSQTIPADQIIVVDDGSTDGTKDILQSYGNAIVTVTQPNKGPSAARNTGLALARGRYVALLDSDDVCKPERLERQRLAMNANVDAVACFTGYWLFNEGGWLLDRPADAAAGHRDPIEYLSNVFFHYPTALYDRGRAADVRFPVGINAGEDLIFTAQLATRGALIGIPDILYGYRLHEKQLSRHNQVTGTSNPYFEERYNWVKAHHSQYWPGKAWDQIEVALWQGLVRQTEDAYWARNRNFFVHDRDYIRAHWPSHLRMPAVRNWKWYPNWMWGIKSWVDRLHAVARSDRQSPAP
jgi:glycosyltransferase involved in cell wall biosynthesis